MHINSSKIAGLLTIGTEVTDGQIINTNGSWLSAKINDLGFNVTHHMSVQDNMSSIVDALDYISSKCNEIFITGGLGPTNDDITRFAVAEYLKLKCEFNQSSWDKIKNRFQDRNITLADTNRQQCMFPVGATIIENPIGTADAFSISKDNKNFYILPGPPREISSIWTSHFSDLFSNLSTNHTELIIWKLMGISESLLAEMIEPLVEGSELVLGYRPHVPYIELKIWIDTKRKSKYQDLISNIRKTVDPWYISHGEFNPYKELAKLVSRELILIDNASQGLFASKIRPFLRFKERTVIGDVKLDKDELPNCEVIVISDMNDDGGWTISCNGDKENLELPFKYRKINKDIMNHFVSELSVLKVLQMMDENE